MLLSNVIGRCQYWTQEIQLVLKFQQDSIWVKISASLYVIMITLLSHKLLSSRPLHSLWPKQLQYLQKLRQQLLSMATYTSSYGDVTENADFYWHNDLNTNKSPWKLTSSWKMHTRHLIIEPIFVSAMLTKWTFRLTVCYRPYLFSVDS